MDEQDQIERDLRYLLEMKGELLMFVIFVQIFNICESHMFARRCRGNVTQLHPAQKILVCYSSVAKLRMGKVLA